MTSCVYFVGIKGQPYVKIGWTTNMKARLKDFRISSPFALEEIGQFPGCNKVEKMCHRAISLHSVRGEWFKRDAAVSLLGFIQSAPTVEEGIAAYKAQLPKVDQYTREQYLGDVAAILRAVLETHTVQETASALGVSYETIVNARDAKNSLNAATLLNLILLKPDALDGMFNRFGRVTEPMPITPDVPAFPYDEALETIDTYIEGLCGLKSRCLSIREARA